MKYKIGDRVKIVSVIKSKSKEIYNKNKELCVGKIGIIYGCHKAYNIDTYDSSLPNGVKVYSIKDERGKDMSPYVWFEEEIEVYIGNVTFTKEEDVISSQTC